MSNELLKQYKVGKQSNYDCLKTEIENLLIELEVSDRIKITEHIAEDILQDIKSIRLTIATII